MGSPSIEEVRRVSYFAKERGAANFGNNSDNRCHVVMAKPPPLSVRPFAAPVHFYSLCRIGFLSLRKSETAPHCTRCGHNDLNISEEKFDGE